jgi:hypothetical protein
VAEVVKVAAVV